MTIEPTSARRHRPATVGTLTALALGLGTGIAVPAATAADFEVTIRNLTPGMYFTPFIVTAHTPSMHLFTTGEPASQALQRIAEGGDVGPMAEMLAGAGASVVTGDGLLGPGESTRFTISDDGGNSVLSVAAMILPSNDGFVALDALPLPHAPIGSQVSRHLPIYDAGTEANDEIVGGGGPGEAGFPAPPPIMASGTGSGATGILAPVEGHVAVHKGVLGDLDPTGGASDINAAVHGWQNPAAEIRVVRLSAGQGDGGSAGQGSGPGSVSDLTGQVYSSSALELFWSPVAGGDDPVVAYEIARDGQVVVSRDAQSFFDEGLEAGTSYHYTVTAIDASGRRGHAADLMLTTHAH